MFIYLCHCWHCHLVCVLRVIAHGNCQTYSKATLEPVTTAAALEAEAWNLSQYCFILLHNTDASMLCRLFDDHKYMYIYHSIHQEYCYLAKQILVCILPHQLVNTCDLVRLVMCAICGRISAKMLLIVQF